MNKMLALPQSLSQRLTQFNNLSMNWVAEDPENRWSSEFVVDLEHWAAYGITTAEQFDAMLDAEDEKEKRKAAYADFYLADEEPVAEKEEDLSRYMASTDRLMVGLSAFLPATI